MCVYHYMCVYVTSVTSHLGHKVDGREDRRHDRKRVVG